MKETMKKSKTGIAIISLMAILLVMMLTLSSCITIRVNSLKGSGDLKTQDYQIEDFNSLDFSGIGNIEIVQGDDVSLKIEAEDNILDAMKVENTGNSLVIGFKRGFMNVVPTKNISIHLTVKDLEKIDISGAGSIKCEKLETEKFVINSSGLGSIDVGLNGQDLKVSISGVGKVNMKGEVDTQQVDISGAGSYSAKELISRDCEVDISGAGRATVNVTDTLDVQLSGVGSVEYTGNPSVTQNISGVGGAVKSAE